MDQADKQVKEISEWINNFLPDIDPEALDWLRLGKVAEEYGEAVNAFIGYKGQNVRKGIYSSKEDFLAELLDIAVTAICAYEHFDGYGNSLHDLADKIDFIYERAGLNARPDN
jgi:hypothetical protein